MEKKMEKGSLMMEILNTLESGKMIKCKNFIFYYKFQSLGMAKENTYGPTILLILEIS